jgi:hypothetical protein
MRTSFIGRSASAAERRDADLFLADLLGVPLAALQRSQPLVLPPAISGRPIMPIEEAWAENAIPEPALPQRQPGAMSGSAFMKTIWSEKAPGAAEWTRREEAMIAQLLAGNMPSWLRQWVAVEVQASSPKVTVRVMPDYLCVGDDTDFRHVPLDQHSAQRVADMFGACLPTAKICHAIYRTTPATQRIGALERDYYVRPWTLRRVVKKNWEQTSTAAYDEHSTAIQASMSKAGIRPGQIIAGHKKDVVVSKRLHKEPLKIAFHGFYDAKGNPAEPCREKNAPQPCNKEAPALAHPEGRFSDYSQGVRLMHPVMQVDGALKLVREVLTDAALCKLISIEDPIIPPRIPPAAKAFPGENYEDNDKQRPCGCGGHR